MSPNPNRIQVIDFPLLKIAQEKYLPHAKKGIKVPSNSLPHSQYPEISENTDLLHLTMAHRVPDKLLLNISEAASKSLNAIKEATKNNPDDTLNATKIITKEFAALRSNLQKLLIQDSAKETVKQEIMSLPLTNSEAEIKKYIQAVIKIIAAEKRKSREFETVKEFKRGVLFHGQPIPNESQTQAVAAFKALMESKKADPLLTDFLLDYLNQEYLITGANFFAGPFIQTLTEMGMGTPQNDYSRMSSNVDVEGPDSILVTFQKNINSLIPANESISQIPDKVKAKYFLQYRIKKNPGTADGYSNVSVEILDGYLDIYDPVTREKYLEVSASNAVAKIRNHELLTATDHNVIELFLEKFRGSDDNLIVSDALNADALFLLMWKNVATAEQILTFRSNSFNPFFARESAKITQDLEILQKKYYFSNAVKIGVDRYTSLLATFRSVDTQKIFDVIDTIEKPSLVEVEHALATISPINTKEIIASFGKIKTLRNEYVANVTPARAAKVKQANMKAIKKALETFEKNTIDNIAGELVGANREQVLMTMLSINDVPTIKNLIIHPQIRNFLSNEVLTHFALQSPEIAASLMVQKKSEYIKFKFKSLFNLTSQHEKLPSYNFKSGQLKEIISTYPSFWNTLFSNKFAKQIFNLVPNYREHLSPEDLSEMIAPDQVKSDAFYPAASNILNDDNLRKKASAHKPITLEQRFNYLLKDRYKNLGRLARDKDLWKELHMGLSDDQLLKLYKTKLEDDYERTNSSLMEVMEDLWRNNQKESFRTEWVGNIPSQPRDNKAIAKQALISVLENKTFSLSEVRTNDSDDLNLPETMTVAECFIFYPNAKIFHSEYFTKEGINQLHFDLLSNRTIFVKLFEMDQFKQFIKLPENEKLYKICWKIARESKRMDVLLELCSLLPEQQFVSFLESNRKNREFLIETLITQDSFYKQFISQMATRQMSILVLLRSATPQQLIYLLLKRAEFGNLFFSAIKKFSELGSDYRETFRSFLEQLTREDLALLIAKYPVVIERMKDFDLFSDFKERIFIALADTGSIIDPAKVQAIKNSHPSLMQVMLKNDQLAITVASDRELNRILKDLYNADDAAEIAKYLINVLSEPKPQARLLELVFSDRELMNRLIQSLSSNLKLLESIVKGLEAAKLSDILANFVNLVTIKALSDSTLLNVIVTDATFKRFINKYAKESFVAYALTQANNLVLSEDHHAGLTRVLLDTTLFEHFLPRMINFHGFTRWLVKLLGQNSDAQQQEKEGKDFDSNSMGWEKYKKFFFRPDQRTNQPLFTSAQVEALLEKDDFDALDFLNWLLRQYRFDYPISDKMGEPNLSDMLNKNSNLRFKLLKKLKHTTVPIVAEVIIQEFKKDPNSLLLQDLLSNPYIDYFVENAPCAVLEKLAQTFSQSPTHQSALMGSICKLFFENKNLFKEKILSSSSLFDELVQHYPSEGEDYRTIIKSALDMPKIYSSVETMLNARHQTIAKSFLNAKDNSQLISLLVMLCKHDTTNGIYQVLDYVLNTDDTFPRIFNQNLKPEIQLQLLLVVLKQARSTENHDAKQHAFQLRKYLKENPLSTQYADHLLSSLSEHDLISLYLADGLVLPNKSDQDPLVTMRKLGEVSAREKFKKPGANTFRKSVAMNIKEETQYYFRNMIERDNYNFLNRIFLFAEEDQLLQLFAANTALLDQFAFKVLPLEKDADINTDKDMDMVHNQIITDLRKRIGTCNAANRNNLTSFMIMHLQEDMQINLMKSHESIYGSFLKQFTLYPDLLIQSKNFKGYFNYIITNGSTADLIKIIESSAPKDKAIVNSIYNELTAENQRNDDICNQLITKHFVVDPSSGNKLLELMMTHLSLPHLMEMLLKNPALETEFVKLAQQKPHLLTNLFVRTEDFLEYFVNGKEQVNLYVLLGEKLPDSELIKHLRKEFAVNSELSKAVLAQAKSVQLAKIYNQEKDNTLKPLTKLIFAEEGLCRTMFEALPEIDPSLVVSVNVKGALQRFPYATEAYIKAFKVRSDLERRRGDILVFKDDSKISSNNYRNGYFYALHAVFSRRLTKTRDPHLHYFDYVKKMNELVELDPQGVLIHKDNREAVEPRFALFYYEAFARFFYQNGDNSFQQKIETRPKLCEALLKSVIFKPDGTLVFAHPNLDTIPTYYMHAVLYALCQSQTIEPMLLEQPHLIKALVNSVGYDEDSLIFCGTDNIKLPGRYLEVMYHIIRNLLDATNPEHIVLIGLLPEREEKFKEILKDSTACENILASLNFTENGQIMFNFSEEKPPKFYVNLVLEIFKQKLTNPSSIDPMAWLLIDLLPDCNKLLERPEISKALVSSFEFLPSTGVIQFGHNHKKIPDFFGATIQRAMFFCKDAKSTTVLLEECPGLRKTWTRSFKAKKGILKEESKPTSGVDKTLVRSQSRTFGEDGSYPNEPYVGAYTWTLTPADERKHPGSSRGKETLNESKTVKVKP